jgi:hypothetical protein
MNNDMVVNKDQAVQTNLPARYPTPGTGHNPVSRSREIPASTRALASVPANAPQAKKKQWEPASSGNVHSRRLYKQ